MATALTPEIAFATSYERDYLEHNRFLPLERTATHARIAVCGDLDADVLGDLERELGVPIDIVQVSDEELADGIRRAFAGGVSMQDVMKGLEADAELRAGDMGDAGLTDARDLAQKAPVIQYVDLLIKEAHAARASDIHLETTDTGLTARLRIDGVLADAPAPPPRAAAAVVSRVKLLAGMDIAERRAPQDGRIRLRLDARDLDIRVSTLPASLGESLVLRLLDRGGQPVALSDLGMDPVMLGRFKSLIAKPTGLVIASGPTGSGKSTTLHAALRLRDARTEKIITVEDPVEYHLAGVTQVPVNPKAGMTFAGALRSILRQDPNVVMVGEMRDAETAAVAIHAAMTGQLVLTTLHTNDAPSAALRLLDLGVEAFRIGASMNGVLAQRLVRRICAHCREEYEPDPSVVSLLSGEPEGRPVLIRGRGCAECRGTGYHGRTGIFELMVVSPELNHAITAKQSLDEVRALAKAHGMRTLLQDGWVKVQAHITTVEEVLRVAAS